MTERDGWNYDTPAPGGDCRKLVTLEHVSATLDYCIAWIKKAAS